MNICVLGAGSLGCAIGGTLAAAGHDVCLVNRHAALVDAVNRDGLALLATHDAASARHVRCRAATRCAGLPAADLLIVLVKTFDTAQAIAGADSALGPHTLVLSLQNGLGAEDILAQAVGRQRLLVGRTFVGGELVGPGRVVATTAGKPTVIGALDPALGPPAPRVQALAEAFAAAGLATTVSANIVGALWDKLLVNVATGALAGITRLPYGLLYQMDALRQTARAAVGEAIAVAQAAGVTLACTDADQPWLRAGSALPFDFKPSLLQSLEKGSVTEIDHINGAVVREGERLGVATPVNATLVACIKGIERGLLERRSAAGGA